MGLCSPSLSTNSPTLKCSEELIAHGVEAHISGIVVKSIMVVWVKFDAVGVYKNDCGPDKCGMIFESVTDEQSVYP